MNRIIEIEIAGKTYPLNFSVKAAREVSERYGGIENVGTAIGSNDVAKSLDEIIWLLALLISQGVAYKRIHDGENVDGITADELEVIIGLSDINALSASLMGAMTAGMKQTVEVEPGKNAETTQGN